MSTPITLTAEHARRFLVRRQMLAPPRALPARAESVLTVIDRLGSLQFDPIEVPGARNHDLVLHARIDGYRREWCDHWLYGPQRRLIEMYNKMLSIVPMAELPYYSLQWTDSAEHYNERILTEEGAVADAILERIRTDGPLSTADFKEHAHSIDWWWAPTRAARAVLEALFVTGRARDRAPPGQPPLLRSHRAARSSRPARAARAGRGRKPASAPVAVPGDRAHGGDRAGRAVLRHRRDRRSGPSDCGAR